MRCNARPHPSRSNVKVAGRSRSAGVPGAVVKVHFHFIPTRSSWLNQVETWFSILQGQSLNGASFTDVTQLQEHIDAFIAAYNETAQPFAWTKRKVHQRRFKNRRITQV